VIEREPAEIEIFKLELINYSWPTLKIKIRCSSGTYIRTLAHDLGQKLGAGALVSELERTAINGYNLSEARQTVELKDDWEKYLFEI
jgi:tRNA pseudouridine55 synthase